MKIICEDSLMAVLIKNQISNFIILVVQNSNMLKSIFCLIRLLFLGIKFDSDS